MMAAERINDTLIDQLPTVRGRYSENAPLDKITWFRVGGPAEVMFRPADLNDLKTFLAMRPLLVPVTFMGVGSNLLVRDGGIPGVVVRLGGEFAGVRIKGTEVTAGAGALGLNVALTAGQAGLTGLEFMSGIPGTVGGALRMNAGAYGSEIKDVLVSSRAIDEEGKIHELSCADMGFGYRHSAIDETWIFVEAVFKGRPDSKSEIARRMGQIQAAREESQPLRTPTGGSTFANPPGHKAWQLIEQAGCRGLRMGGAMVSEKHCNFLVNTGTASAADLEKLGETVRQKVLDKTGVTLEWEIRRVGVSDGGTS